MTSEDAPPRSFRCPKLDCGADYFAVEQEVPPVAKPKCLECGTPFLARTSERFVHYYPTRHIFD
jgi:ribosomal protein S27AE